MEAAQASRAAMESALAGPSAAHPVESYGSDNLSLAKVLALTACPSKQHLASCAYYHGLLLVCCPMVLRMASCANVLVAYQHGKQTDPYLDKLCKQAVSYKRVCKLSDNQQSGTTLHHKTFVVCIMHVLCSLLRLYCDFCCCRQGDRSPAFCRKAKPACSKASPWMPWSCINRSVSV